MGWIQKMEVRTNHLTNPQRSFKHASITFFVSHGPKMITTLVLIVLFEYFGHSCVLRYVKPTILAIFGSPRLAQNGQFGVFCN